MLEFKPYEFSMDHTPSEEEDVSLWNLLRDLFPFYRLQSFVTVSLTVHLVFYVINMILVLTDGENPEASEDSTMVEALECYPYGIMNLQLYRLLTSLMITPTLDSLLTHTIFNLMVVSFVEEKLGSKQTAIVYYGSGLAGNIFSILFQDTSCVSNVGSLAMFLLSLQLQHHIFKADFFKDYENYHQPLGLYLYKGAIYCFLIYHYTANEQFANYYMFLGGVLAVALERTASTVLMLPLILFGLCLFFLYRNPSF